MKPTPERWQAAGAPVLFSAIVALFVLLGIVRCPMAVLFHVPCPGCGTTRAVLAVLRFDFAGVLRFNPVAPFLVFAIGLLILRMAVLTLKEGNSERVMATRAARLLLWAISALFVVEIAVWGLRMFGLLGGPCPV